MMVFEGLLDEYLNWLVLVGPVDEDGDPTDEGLGDPTDEGLGDPDDTWDPY